MRKTLQELREERGESRTQLAKALGVMPNDVLMWETGRTEPGISRLRVLAEHFGVRDGEITLKPDQPPTHWMRLTGDRGKPAQRGAMGSSRQLNPQQPRFRWIVFC